MSWDYSSRELIREEKALDPENRGRELVLREGGKPPLLTGRNRDFGI